MPEHVPLTFLFFSGGFHRVPACKVTLNLVLMKMHTHCIHVYHSISSFPIRVWGPVLISYFPHQSVGTSINFILSLSKYAGQYLFKSQSFTVVSAYGFTRPDCMVSSPHVVYTQVYILQLVLCPPPPCIWRASQHLINK